MEVATIREATRDDAERLQAYATELFAEGLPGIYRLPAPSLDEELAFVARYTDPANSVLLIAEAGGEIVGVIGLLGRTLEQERHVGALGVSVARRWRGQGVGSKLLDAACEWASTHGVSRVEIEAFSNNPRAVSLYERHGFVREGVRRKAVEIDGEYQDAICLVKFPMAQPPSKDR